MGFSGLGFGSQRKDGFLAIRYDGGRHASRLCVTCAKIEVIIWNMLEGNRVNCERDDDEARIRCSRQQETQHEKDESKQKYCVPP